MAGRSRLGALQERQFRLLWLGRTTSAIGDGLIGVALAFAVIHETGSAADLGVVMTCFTLGRAGLVVVAGVWADRLPRRLVMVTADLVRAMAQGVVAFLLISGTADIWHLAVAAFVSGAATAFFGPSSTAFVPDAVSPGRLQQANALISTSGSSAELFGPALSGFLVWSFGAGWVFAIDAATYALSAAFLLSMRVRETPGEERQPFLREVAGGLRLVAERQWLWVSLASFALGNVALASYFVIGPVIAERELDGRPRLGADPERRVSRSLGRQLARPALETDAPVARGEPGDAARARHVPRPDPATADGGVGRLHRNDILGNHVLQRAVGDRASGARPASGAVAGDLARLAGLLRLHADRLHDRRAAVRERWDEGDAGLWRGTGWAGGGHAALLRRSAAAQAVAFARFRFGK